MSVRGDVVGVINFIGVVMRYYKPIAMITLILACISSYADHKSGILPFASDVTDKNFSEMLGCYFSNDMPKTGLFPKFFILTSVRYDTVYYDRDHSYYTYSVENAGPSMGLYWLLTGRGTFSIGSTPGPLVFAADFVKLKDANAWHTLFRRADDVGHSYTIEATYENVSKHRCYPRNNIKKKHR